jgi:hypothetical protein
MCSLLKSVNWLGPPSAVDVWRISVVLLLAVTGINGDEHSHVVSSFTLYFVLPIAVGGFLAQGVSDVCVSQLYANNDLLHYWPAHSMESHS